MPIFFLDFGRGTGVYSNARVANQPITERLMVQVLTTASAGSSLDRRTFMLPILETCRYFPDSLKPVLLNANESYLSLFLNLGKPAFLPPSFRRRKKFSNERFSFLTTF